MTVGTLDYVIPQLTTATGVSQEFAVRTDADEWASEDILTPEVLAAFHRASEELLAKRPSS